MKTYERVHGMGCCRGCNNRMSIVGLIELDEVFEYTSSGRYRATVKRNELAFSPNFDRI